MGKQANPAACFVCGAGVLRTNREMRVNRHHFCSKDCWREYVSSVGRATKECPICKKSFSGFSSYLKRHECCSRICGRAMSRMRKGHKAWLDRHGYWNVMHYRAGRRQACRVHVLIAEMVLKRPLKEGEVVHHINLNTKDNRHKNLLICTNGYHRQIHSKMAYIYAKEHFAGAQQC